MTNNVRLTFTIGDTTWTIYDYFLARQIESVILNTIFSVVTQLCPGLDHIFIWLDPTPPMPPSLPDLPTRTCVGTPLRREPT